MSYIHHTNPNCKHLGERDEGYGPYECHDEYCYLRECWCPDCTGCTDATDNEEEEDEIN